MKLRFVSGNQHKIREAEAILGPVNIEVISAPFKIEELQTEDTPKLVRDKVLKAFANVGRPLFVEHTGLYLKQLNQLPGGLTQIFWDTLMANQFSARFGQDDTAAIARTTIGYCDGRHIRFYNGEISGVITDKPRGDPAFQWDCVFQPDGYDKTFAEMGALKNEISMRRRALDAMADALGAAR